MKLLEFVKKQFEHGPELFVDEKVHVNDKGVSVMRNCKRLREMSLGLISSNNADEWYRICRLNCEPGTIIEEYNEEDWTELYNDMLSLVRNELTKCLLKEREKKSAKTLLDILSKRDKDHWDNQKQQSFELKKGDETISFRFEGING